MSNLAEPGTMQKAPRQRSEAHLRRIRSLPCVMPGCARPAEAAHVRMASALYGKRETGVGEKPSDRFVVPLCGYHHVWGPEAQHRSGERTWWLALGVDPLGVAVSLWDAKDLDAMRRIVEAVRARR